MFAASAPDRGDAPGRVRPRSSGPAAHPRRAFRTTIEVDPEQTVVSTGPYRWVRHPSYCGLLLIVAGFGLSTGNWLSLAACVVVPLPALVRRIHLEEAELDRVLGAAYRTYESGKARLIPRLW